MRNSPNRAILGIVAWLVCATVVWAMWYRLNEGADSIVILLFLLLFLVATISGVIGFFWLIGWSRESRWRFRENAGLCTRCGYDIRGCGSQCSECGMPIWQDRDPLTGQPIPRNSIESPAEK